jgi:hypothetical protein
LASLQLIEQKGKWWFYLLLWNFLKCEKNYHCHICKQCTHFKKEKRKSGRTKGKNPCVKEARGVNLVKMEMLNIFFVHCYIHRWKWQSKGEGSMCKRRHIWPKWNSDTRFVLSLVYG